MQSSIKVLLREFMSVELKKENQWNMSVSAVGRFWRGPHLLLLRLLWVSLPVRVGPTQWRAVSDESIAQWRGHTMDRLEEAATSLPGSSHSVSEGEGRLAGERGQHPSRSRNSEPPRSWIPPTTTEWARERVLPPEPWDGPGFDLVRGLVRARKAERGPAKSCPHPWPAEPTGTWMSVVWSH